MSDLIPNSSSDPLGRPSDTSGFPDRRAGDRIPEDSRAPANLTEEQKTQRQQLKRIYITLVLSGLAIGGVLSIVIVKLMQHFGLTGNPGG